ncbi:MAG: 4-alpha-glucanotransferase, partial [Acidimicrobiia bacterium]
MKRRSGVLTHVTSLPGHHGIGTLGEEARRFAETLADAGQRLWQMLPVGPTGYRDSPYQSPSTFAGNPLLIDLDDLVVDGLLHRAEIEQLTALPRHRVDFGELIPDKNRLLILAARRFLRRGDEAGFDDFRRTPWLDPYATYAAIKQSYGGRSWTHWEPGLATRTPAALARASARLAGRIEVERAIQYFFHRQWEVLRAHCHSNGIALIGDIPIFVAHDSADVWSRP